MDRDRMLHGFGGPPSASTTSYEPFTVHWAQIPEPTIRSSSRRLSASWSISSPLTISTTTRTASIRGTKAKSQTNVSEESKLSSLTATMHHAVTTVASSGRFTTLTTTSTSAGSFPTVGLSSDNDLLSGGATAAVVVSSFLAFSICGFLAWLRWRYVKKRRAGETTPDFSSLHSDQRGEGPMVDMRAIASASRILSPAHQTAESTWSGSPEPCSYGNFTRTSARGAGVRAGEATLVELPGDIPVNPPRSGSRAPDVAGVREAAGHPSLSRMGRR